MVGYGASPNECCDIVRKVAEVTILGNHDAAVAGRMDYSYYYEAARHALDTHAAMLTRENMEWLKTPALQAPRRRDGRRPLPRLAGAPRGVRVHLRARAGARVPADLGRARPHHAHRPLAPVQGVRAHARHGARAAAADLRSRRGRASTSSASARSASRATTTTARATRSTTATRSASSSSASSTTSSRPPTGSSRAASSATSATACSSASRFCSRAEPRAPDCARARNRALRPPLLRAACRKARSGGAAGREALVGRPGTSRNSQLPRGLPGTFMRARLSR